MFAVTTLVSVSLLSPLVWAAKFEPNVKFNFTIPAASPFITYNAPTNWSAEADDSDSDTFKQAKGAMFALQSLEGISFDFVGYGVVGYALTAEKNATNRMPAIHYLEDNSEGLIPVGSSGQVFALPMLGVSNSLASIGIHGASGDTSKPDGFLQFDLVTGLMAEGATYEEVNKTTYPFSEKDSDMFRFSGAQWTHSGGSSSTVNGYIEVNAPQNTSFVYINCTLQTPLGEALRAIYVKYTTGVPPVGNNVYEYNNAFENLPDNVESTFHFLPLDPAQRYTLQVGCDQDASNNPCTFNSITFGNFFKNGTGPPDPTPDSKGEKISPTGISSGGSRGSGEHKVNAAAIAGGTVGGAVALVIAGAVIWRVAKHQARKPRKLDPSTFVVDETADQGTPFMSQAGQAPGMAYRNAHDYQERSQSHSDDTSEMTSLIKGNAASNDGQDVILEEDAGALPDRLPPTYNPAWAGSDGTVGGPGPSTALSSNWSASRDENNALTPLPPPPLPVGAETTRLNTAKEEKEYLRARYGNQYDT